MGDAKSDILSLAGIRHHVAREGEQDMLASAFDGEAASAARETSGAIHQQNLAVEGARDVSLAEINSQWTERLASDLCPPLLGLAPMPDAEAAEVRELVLAKLGEQPGGRFNRLVGMVEHFPAVMAVWLSRVAGEAYDEHNFWRPFGEKLRFQDFTQAERESLVRAFRRVCQATMSAFVEPEVGAWRLAGQFLFQAGLPLSHCGRFAQSLKSVARELGLPEPEDAGAVEDFRWAMLERTEIQQAPVVVHALAATSGLHLLASALRVVREDAYAEINPALGDKLRTEFQHVGVGGGAVALRSPFLRLRQDCASFEVVCPRQPEALLAGAGPRWRVNGQNYYVGRQDELAVPVAAGDGPATVELRGLVDGRSLKRELQLAPAANRPPAFLFKASDLKQRTLAGDGSTYPLECGDYWLVHRVEDAVDGAETSFPWDSGELSTTLVKVRPGCGAILQDAGGQPVCEFKPAISPFIELHGQSVVTDDGQRIHYRWTDLPTVWIPAADAGANWTLRVSLGESQETVRLAPLPGSREGELVPCQPVGQGWLAGLAPGLHEIRLELMRGSRRQGAAENRLLWIGLESASTSSFRLSAVPGNFRPQHSAGFEVAPNCVRHLQDRRREHVLAFEVGDAVRASDSRSRALSWNRSKAWLARRGSARNTGSARPFWPEWIPTNGCESGMCHRAGGAWRSAGQRRFPMFARSAAVSAT